MDDLTFQQVIQQRDYLGDALARVLVAVGVLGDAAVSGPLLLLAAETYLASGQPVHGQSVP